LLSLKILSSFSILRVALASLLFQLTLRSFHGDCIARAVWESVVVVYTSGCRLITVSRYVKLHRYFPGAVAELAEQRKAKAYSRLWNVESERARLIFFAVELSGCFGPEEEQMSDDSRDGGRRTGCTQGGT
jgi:hypothetical protein